ncbi:MAG: BrnA antitoxin family protein [Planctomycetes bacterium]|nr:BrnA antitoxin family protein [Planctomycetota bacterium]
MRKEYDLTHLKWKPNPYARRLKKLVTIRLDSDLIVYFKALSREIGIPYQRLINLYLRECAVLKRKPAVHWVDAS